MSPFLFSIFLHDLHDHLESAHVNGVNIEYNLDDAFLFLKLLILLYADDTVIISESSEDLQYALSQFGEYYRTWKLTVNVSKTKVIIFSKGKSKVSTKFYFENKELEIEDRYKYLGIILSRNGSFVEAKKHIAEQGNKALFSLLRKSRQLQLPYDIQIELFEKTIKPILLYGCEIWGYGNLDVIERVQLKYFKYIFNMKKSTPSYMVYGKLGITPLKVDISTRIVSFWSKLVNNIENSKLFSLIYNILFVLYNAKQIKSQWIENVKDLLCEFGFSGIWITQSFLNSKYSKYCCN